MARVLPSLHCPLQPQRPMGPPHRRLQVKEPVEPELVVMVPTAVVVVPTAVVVVVVLPPAPVVLAGGLSTTTFPPQPQARRSAPLKTLTGRVIRTARHASMEE